MLARRFLSPNPILIKELRSRMRGARAFVTMTLVLLALGGISYLLFRIVLAQLQYSTAPASPQIGQALFSGLALLELMIVCAVTPAVTASAISGEKEKLTYEMLAATPLRPASILSGKLISALSFVLILIFAAVPMFSLVFTFGGVTIREMVKALLVIGSVALMLGVMGMFFSALFGRTGRATVASYLVLVFLLVVPYMIYLGRGILIQAPAPREVLVLSPITALFSALQPSLNGQYPMSFMWMLGGGFGPDLWFGTPQMSIVGIPRPIYHYSLPLYGGMTVVLYLVTTRLVQPAHRWRMRVRDLLVGAGVLLVYAGCVALFFYLTANRYENVQNLTGPVDIVPPPPAQIMAAIEPAIPVPADVQDSAANGSGTQEFEVEASNLSLLPEDQADLYAEVIRRMYTIDHTFDDAPNFATVYVLTVADELDRGSQPGEPACISHCPRSSGHGCQTTG